MTYPLPHPEINMPHTVYLMADRDFPTALFSGTMQECRAFLKQYRKDYPNIRSTYFRIQ